LPAPDLPRLKIHRHSRTLFLPAFLQQLPVSFYAGNAPFSGFSRIAPNMQTTPILPSQFQNSVLAVPPLARNVAEAICPAQNLKIVRHLEAGGVSMLLYGGNANLYNIRYTEYARLLEILEEIAGEHTAVIPSVGPAYGLMMDQADLLKSTKFPTVMVLPTKAIMTEPGLMTGFRRFVETIGRPAVLYIKEEGYISPEGAAELVRDGLVSFIKYAIVQQDPGQDDYLSRLVTMVDPNLICSGIGEQPALVHMTRFQLNGYTSGCVCINPALSQEMLKAILQKNYDRAEAIRRIFLPLETLRNEINPIRVLHEAVALAEIAATGRQFPLLSGVSQTASQRIQQAALELLHASG
jgi:dihydrodipicolinate synthase/N-acetylneuraminate lyase